MDLAARDADSPAVLRHGDRDVLSLALMRARNRTLRWLAAFEQAGELAMVERERFSPPHWLAGHAGWYQEYWIARHVQRSRGARADAAGVRLPSIEPQADRWWDPAQSTRAERWAMDLPSGETLRACLAQTFETTLELLGHADAGDDGLHPFRAALHHEAGLDEAFAELAQACELPPVATAELRGSMPVRAARPPIGLPSRRWRLGSEPGGFVPAAEQWSHDVVLSEFEIDAQPVSWAQFAEFVEDGGYDERRWWSDAGWAWLQAQVAALGPRCPRYVEQIRRGVALREQGRLGRVPPLQAARHVSAHEAEAWCRWAGRRLPTEAEWECAAATATGRGFVWGDVWEWVADRARFYPGHPVDDGAAPAGARVLRGASWLTARVLRHPKARRFAAPDADEAFCGFRSCG
jgi:ergothioneine biosynthesis protein EgtB